MRSVEHSDRRLASRYRSTAPDKVVAICDGVDFQSPHSCRNWLATLLVSNTSVGQIFLQAARKESATPMARCCERRWESRCS